ncbi:MAG: PaaI family thioesterase, partial [Xanthomonadales bacterium]|nr:PaaI family thioesterase [Xanthomonadales bacterium]
YPEEYRQCFGCGTENEHGHHVESQFDGDEVVAHFTPKPFHTAFPGVVYGGLLASIIDCHGIGSAAAFAHRAEGKEIGQGDVARYVTGALEVSFKAPTPMGEELELRAREVERSERKVIVAVTVSAGGAVTAEGKVVAIRLKESPALA